MTNLNNKKLKTHRLSEVTSIISHQLKTPISVIKGCLEVLRSKDLGELNKKQKEYLEDALENTKKMNDLVKDLLDVAKIEEDKLEVKSKLSNLEEIIKKLVDNFYLLSKAKNCTITFKVVNKIPSTFFDPLKIEQVASNIISNAISYNKRQGIIKIILEKKGDDILFSCEDTGVGIADDEKERVFKKFYRSERTIPLDTSGSGLGLFIAKAIIEKNKGEIWLESEENKGTTFYFSLPITESKK